MNDDLKLTMNSEPVPSTTSEPNFSTGEVKKKSGCGCLAGCLGVILLFIAPFIAGGIYVASLSDEQKGEKIVGFLANDAYTQQIKDGINSNDKMTPEEKTVFLGMYNSFQTKYNSLPPQQQTIIHKNAYKIIKIIFTNPDQLSQQPPEEFLQILDVLAIMPQQAQDQTSITTFTATTPSVATSTTTAVDPYGFGSSTNTASQLTTTPTATNTATTTATGSGYKTDYDF